jgi:DNA-binding MarR family transcriptional regulator
MGAASGTVTPNRMTRATTMKRSWGPAPAARTGKVIDLERYAPAYLTFVANKLGRGASRNYLRVFNVGVETWRCLVLLAIHTSITAQRMSTILGMDKAAVSRCFKGMQARKLITMGLDEADGRVRVATLTPAGRALHDEIREMALERERALLSVLSDSERDVLLGLLKRLHENLPAVEKATESYVARHYPKAVHRQGQARARAAH